MLRPMLTTVLHVAALLAAAGVPAMATAVGAQPPIALHPGNPHYFLWRGKPTILVGSGEHYGAVLNRPFDYVKYLNTLEKCGLNHTRLFMGLYVEDNADAPKSTQARNSLDPAAGQLICPFARGNVPGYAKGGNKFDLQQWDPAFFSRLNDFVGQAAKRGVVVEVNLFCPYYEDRQWKLSPLNPQNNVGGIGPAKRTDVFSLDRHQGLLPVQEAMVKRIVGALRDYDNIYYEICNEPYCAPIKSDWQQHIANAIIETERSFAQKHLISQNIANKQAKVEKPCAGVSIFNFHYGSPPDTVVMNYELNKPIGDNETGFQGQADRPYRREAWEFLLAGGALFSHLDYSFTVGHEDGSFVLPSEQLGGGSPALRQQLRYLKNFMEGFDFVRMIPNDKVIRSSLVTPQQAADPKKVSARALVEPGQQYAVYVSMDGGTKAVLEIDLPPGSYRVQWLHPRTGQTEPTTNLTHAGGIHRFESPAAEEDIAVSIRRIAASGQGMSERLPARRIR